VLYDFYIFMILWFYDFMIFNFRFLS